MANRPTHRAFIVEDPRNDDDKAHWTEVGVICPHKNGEGFDLMIKGQLSVAGRVVCMPIKDEAERPANGPTQRRDRGAEPRQR